MIFKVYSVRDQAVDAFLPVFLVRSRGEAIRSFTQACLDTNHQFFKHKADYVLFELGEWDDVDGLFSSDNPVRVISGLEIGTPD